MQYCTFNNVLLLKKKIIRLFVFRNSHKRSQKTFNEKLVKETTDRFELESLRHKLLCFLRIIVIVNSMANYFELRTGSPFLTSAVSVNNTALVSGTFIGYWWWLTLKLHFTTRTHVKNEVRKTQRQLTVWTYMSLWAFA